MTIIRDYIMRLKLDENAKYPYQVLRDELKMKEVKEEILRLRKLTYGPKLTLVGRDGDIRDRDSDDPYLDSLAGGEQ